MKKHVADLESWEREWFDRAGPALDAARAASAGCPSFMLLSAAAAEALPPDEQRAVEEHVASCESCRAFQADLASITPDDLAPAEVDSGLAGLRRVVAADAHPGRWAWWRTGLAAAALVVVAAAVTWRTTPHGPAVPGPKTPAGNVAAPSRPATRVPAPPAARGAATGPVLEKPEVKFTMAALSWRSPGSAANEFLSALAPGVAAYRAGRFDEAEHDFAGLRTRFPSAVEVPFYLGVSQLFLGKNRLAAASLESAAGLADDSFAADVSWYLAIAWQRAGRAAEAGERFAALCRGSSPYAARACDAARR